ncbi:MAG: hypothetical protein MUO26_13335 [Methanotrichaceae archaeon]|nr:hypothetical protein [Methanotrichaceae archaeon]
MKLELFYYMNFLSYLIILIAFILTFVATREWIPRAAEIGLVGKDMNKIGKPEIAEMGGICVIFGFVLGMLVYIGIMTFYLRSSQYITILATLCTILMMGIIGMMDDILGWKKGLKKWQKPILTIFAAMPMIAISAGGSTMNLPLIGNIDWGLLYPLFIVPVGIVGASNGYNLLAGYNGLEAGMGVIILSTMGYIAASDNRSVASVLAFCMVGALIAFLYFNWYPAKVFPGDTLTYPVGALIACVAIVGDLEIAALILFIPYATDFVLGWRTHFKMEAFASVNEDGTLEQPYEKFHDLTHISVAILKKVKEKVYEKDVVEFICGLEIIIALSILIYFI